MAKRPGFLAGNLLVRSKAETTSQNSRSRCRAALPVRRLGLPEARSPPALCDARRSALSGQLLGGHNGRGEVAGVMGLGRVGKARRLAAGDQAPVAVLPVRRICAGLLPVDESRLVTPVVYAAHGGQVRLASDERVHQVALLPGSAGP